MRIVEQMIREGTRQLLLLCRPVQSVRWDDGLVGVPADSAAVATLYVHLITLSDLLLCSPAAFVSLHQVYDEQREDEDGDGPAHNDSNEDLREFLLDDGKKFLPKE